MTLFDVIRYGNTNLANSIELGGLPEDVIDEYYSLLGTIAVDLSHGKKMDLKLKILDLATIYSIYTYLGQEARQSELYSAFQKILKDRNP